MTPIDVNLYLVGFMGTGKSTVARALAHRLGMIAMDSDHEIEHAKGRAITEIFATDGEAAFRAMERAWVETGHPARGCIVACGGGLIVPPGMLDLLRGKGVVICLHASLETILVRTAGARHRPLLNVEDPEARIRRLYGERESIYRAAGSVVLTDGRPLRDITDHVLRAYRRDASDWMRAHGPTTGSPR